MIRICFVGLGSIGKRHIKNVAQVLRERKQEFVIDAIRCTDNKLPDDICALIQNCYRMEEISGIYDVIFVTNPTIYHYDTIKKLLHKSKHMFVEKPVFHEFKDSLGEFDFRGNGIYYVACPLRYSSVLRELKERLKKERVYSVRVISSSYLPEWRKGVDYREIYSAHKEMGGGVTLDLIHELDYILWLFQMPEMSYHLCGKYSDLEINCDDVSVYLLKYMDKIVEIHTDYIGREKVRNIELHCKNYVIKGDLLRNRLKYVYPDGKVKEVKLLPQDYYLEEMRAFWDMVEGKKDNENSIIYANEVLKIALNNKWSKCLK